MTVLNRVEYWTMNNPLRAAFQRWMEADRLLEVGGRMDGGRALEVGCGRGVGLEILLDRFGAEAVDGFDLDPTMVRRARRRTQGRPEPVRLWTGSVTRIPAPADAYDAVVGFGVIHHVPDWPKALAEIARVLKPGGVFYSEEIFEAFLDHPISRWLFDHPTGNRFDFGRYREGLEAAGLRVDGARAFNGWVGWFAARRPEPGG